MVENSERELNYYQLLNVPRDVSASALKRAHRTMSLMYHPDKNKAEDAVPQFQKIGEAFDTLEDLSKRREYDRLGINGVLMSEHTVIDSRVIAVQLVVHYASSLVFVFVMTMGDTEGDTFALCIFGLLGKNVLFEFFLFFF
jgi:curved DNA-binding protein CbpA